MLCCGMWSKCCFQQTYLNYIFCARFRRWMVLSSKGNIERASRKGIKLGNILKTLTFGDWLVLSLLGSNVQSSYYEQVSKFTFLNLSLLI